MTLSKPVRERKICTDTFPLTYYQRGRYHETPTWKDMIKDMKFFGLIKDQEDSNL